VHRPWRAHWEATCLRLKQMMSCCLSMLHWLEHCEAAICALVSCSVASCIRAHFLMHLWLLECWKLVHTGQVGWPQVRLTYLQLAFFPFLAVLLRVAHWLAGRLLLVGSLFDVFYPARYSLVHWLLAWWPLVGCLLEDCVLVNVYAGVAVFWPRFPRCRPGWNLLKTHCQCRLWLEVAAQGRVGVQVGRFYQVCQRVSRTVKRR
jgi:hypothetical protein